jgi:AcrR family transcriptional regulator
MVGSEPKPKRRTRERVLETALSLFNDYGEPGITATAIADAVGISAGNLHYHFPSKTKIVEAIFASFRTDMESVLRVPELRPAGVEDVWLFLHLIFETIWKYRFLYRDLNELLSGHRVVEVQFKRILARKTEVAVTILEQMCAVGELRATPMEMRTLAVNMTVIATYWLSYEFVRDPRAPAESHALARGVFHVMSLAAPYLEPESRALFDRLAAHYID